MQALVSAEVGRPRVDDPVWMVTPSPLLAPRADGPGPARPGERLRIRPEWVAEAVDRYEATAPDDPTRAGLAVMIAGA